MNKTCARCEKTVYPTEELKCLDKVWHKGCFKCQECGMTLNMRTYKGYGKLPYCESHVPKAKHTTMAETPELKRIAENTKIQSNVVYHADFEKSKGKFTQVADDPETLRIKANTKIISNVAYHGDLEKKAQMEKQRQINENGELVDMPTDYNQQIDNYTTEMLPAPLPPRNNYQQGQYQQQNYSNATPNVQNATPNMQTAMPHIQNAMPNQNASSNQNTHSYSHSNVNHAIHSHPNQHNHGNSISHQNYQNMTHVTQNMPHVTQNMPHVTQNVPQMTQNVQQNVIQMQQNIAQNSRQYPDQYYKKDEYAYQYQDYQYGNQKIGRIQDYDPVSDGPRAPPNTQRASATLIYNSTDKRGPGPQSQSSARPIGRVTDLDPLASEQPRHAAQPAPAPAPAPANTQLNQKVYIAMYDYTANDSDEVSFREGDLISNVSSIDSGWMTGQVLRTRRAGMLPANYVAECPPQHHAHY